MDGVASILVVDDNPKFLSDALPMYGYDVTVAKDGLEALKILMNKTFDIILLDVMMPNMNGWDAARKIRSMKRTDAGTIPIIAMSANAFSEDIINSRISGMNQHLTKPLEEAKILAELKECLSRQESGPGSAGSDQKKG